MANLPPEITVDILSRLPVKSLCRFRCVCKTWRALISDPHFTKLHLNQNHHNERPILVSHSLFTIEYEESSSSSSSSQSVAVAIELDLPDLRSLGRWPSILGSCNGLLVVGNEDDNIHFLLNPSTREYKHLPQSPVVGKNPVNIDNCFSVYGLGYNSRNDDYKIVRIFCNHTKFGSPEVVVSVYTLRTDSWRSIEDYPYDHVNSSPGAFLNGALHWPVCNRGLDYSGVIVCIDLVNEKVREVPPPSFVQHPARQSLGVLGGCLCMLIVSLDGFHYDVCVMKEYGVKESWTKFLITGPNMGVDLECFPGNGEIIWAEQPKLIFYNPNKGTSREVVIRGGGVFLAGMIYVESLVSPNFYHAIDTVWASKMKSEIEIDTGLLYWRKWGNELKRKRCEPFESIDEQLNGSQSSTAQNDIFTQTMEEELGAGPSNVSGSQATLSEATRMAESERAQRMIAYEQRMSAVEEELHSTKSQLTELRAFTRAIEKELHATRSELAELRTFVRSQMGREQ